MGLGAKDCEEIEVAGGWQAPPKGPPASVAVAESGSCGNAATGLVRVPKSGAVKGRTVDGTGDLGMA